MRITTGLCGSLLVLALSVSGCGGGSDAKSGDASTAKPGGGSSTAASDKPSGGESTATGALDVCTLLTAADLQKAFGSPFDGGDATHQDQTGADQCVWVNTDAPPIKAFSLTVLRQGAIAGALKEGGVTVTSLHASAKAAFGDAVAVDLGDDAYLSGTTLAVLDGDTEYTFNTGFGTSDQAISGMKSLAAQVVG
jgi:hypothetical protein